MPAIRARACFAASHYRHASPAGQNKRGAFTPPCRVLAFQRGSVFSDRYCPVASLNRFDSGPTGSSLLPYSASPVSGVYRGEFGGATYAGTLS